ncbi:MAG: hypothetical protein JRI25_11605 [Deltaproteobacteria bacterium]|nr:hypothetical protein [Deltaproteobacteria bacterium]MBW2255231.1 hypothetical protein [Deltaproteobacteria bacterium]
MPGKQKAPIQEQKRPSSSKSFHEPSSSHDNALEMANLDSGASVDEDTPVLDQAAREEGTRVAQADWYNEVCGELEDSEARSLCVQALREAYPNGAPSDPQGGGDRSHVFYQTRVLQEGGMPVMDDGICVVQDGEDPFEVCGSGPDQQLYDPAGGARQHQH